MKNTINVKTIAMFVVFTVCVMTVMGTMLLASIFSFYSGDFVTQIDEAFSGEMLDSLTDAMAYENYPELQSDILRAYSGNFGIDRYRNFYVLDENGAYLSGSNEELGSQLRLTPNLITAMSEGVGKSQRSDLDYLDYAVKLKNGDRTSIIYIKDSKEEMSRFSWELMYIIVQTLIVGLVIAILLSLVLAKAISTPIRRITKGVSRVSGGDFTEKVPVESADEIGTLAQSFNHMAKTLASTIEQVNGERSKLETTFAYLKDGVLTFDYQHKLIQINKAASELCAGRINEKSSLEDALQILDIPAAASAVKGEDGYIKRNTSFEGKMLDVSISEFVYVSENTEREGTIIVLNDVTQNYKLEKSRREFVANVSHELRTPLTSIKSATETIEQNPDLPDELRERFLNIILGESDRMTQLIRDLLELSRIDNKKLSIEFCEFSIKDMLEHITEVMRIEAGKHRHTVNLGIAEDVGLIRGDVHRLEQVMTNVISNSIKYTPDGGRIDIYATKCEGEIHIDVSDTGRGIPKEDIPMLFERFYRVDKARSSETGGTGLGLSITKEIVELHGGRIEIESTVGLGTTVHIVLPERKS